jgi:hypothetical protein
VRQLDDSIGDTFVWAIASSNCAAKLLWLNRDSRFHEEIEMKLSQCAETL